ncbi:hypothetical protein [Methylosinus sp. Ce-a6]|uniref:hypothetical protein n=1 Tax=Methylosinus sp. Ce-a6 TaxID=2172005 RepID=UPI0013598165|nr:hypothetical protein [Methylosinus sp. Ce-a6]
MSVRFPTLLGATMGVGLASAAGAGDLGYPASALGEFSAKPRSSFDNAPPLAAAPLTAAPLAIPLSSDQAASRGVSPAPVAQSEPETTAPSPQGSSSQEDSPQETSPQESRPHDQTPASPAPAPQSPATLDEYEARCFVKIDGRVLIAKTCRILRDKDKEVIFEIDDGPLTIKLRQGRVWTARLKDRDFGNVYKTGSCWGAQGFYACDRGRI